MFTESAARDSGMIATSGFSYFTSNSIMFSFWWLLLELCWHNPKSSVALIACRSVVVIVSG